MPEFQIDLGDMQNTFHALDQFTQAYIEAAFFTESGGDGRACDDKAFSDLAPSTLAEMIEDCHDFQTACAELLAQAYGSEKVAYSAERAGHDFWLTRNRHGAGFWDRGLGQVGRDLSDMARPYSTLDLYLGDDGLIYS